VFVDDATKQGRLVLLMEDEVPFLYALFEVSASVKMPASARATCTAAFPEVSSAVQFIWTPWQASALTLESFTGPTTTSILTGPTDRFIGFGWRVNLGEPITVRTIPEEFAVTYTCDFSLR
jgi:hypothetical protein